MLTFNMKFEDLSLINTHESRDYREWLFKVLINIDPVAYNFNQNTHAHISTIPLCMFDEWTSFRTLISLDQRNLR